MQGDLDGARKSYAAARWRPSRGCNKCPCEMLKDWQMNREDQRTTPHVLIEELRYMEYHKGVSNANPDLRLVSGSTCENAGCTDIKSATECEQAARTLNVPLNGGKVAYPQQCA